MHNLFWKQASGHESEITQTTLAKEAFVNVKTHHWLVSNSTSVILGHFASFAVPPDILTLFLTVIQLGLRLYKWRHIYSNKMSEVLLYFAKPRLFHWHKSSCAESYRNSAKQQAWWKQVVRTADVWFAKSNRPVRDTLIQNLQAYVMAKLLPVSTMSTWGTSLGTSLCWESAKRNTSYSWESVGNKPPVDIRKK